MAKTQAFAQGRTFDLGYCQTKGFDKDRHFAFLRSDGEKTFLVLANFGPTTDIFIHIPSEALDYLGIETKQTEYVLSVPERDFRLTEL